MAIPRKPRVIILAGPNGAGKSTSGPAVVRETLGVRTYVDADMIARGISPKAPGAAALRAGRVMIRQLHDLAARRSSFAFETTLASRSFAPWIKDLTADGWRFHAVFLWLPSADLAVARVRDRVRTGGHDVPEDVVRRRYAAGLRNFFELYQPLAATWRMYDNSLRTLRLIARGKGRRVTRIAASELWSGIVEEFGRG